MKKELILLISLQFVSTGFAVGPNELNFDGARYFKTSEKLNGNSLAAEYASRGGNSASKIIVTHVRDKNNPNKIATDLKTKKGVEVVDIENLKDDHSDVLVRFIQFDVPNSKVKNNICRIKRSANQNGSVVFQYVESKQLRSHAEGSVMPDFTKIADNMKLLPVEQYSTSLSQRIVPSGDAYVPRYHASPRYKASSEYQASTNYQPSHQTRYYLHKPR
jgi:hypothetical protein